ncbi:MAG: SDR family oxidoreductase [Myxococcota bacterium]
MQTGLKERVAVVAASSQGIGLAVAHALAAEGARVAMFARRPDVLSRAADEVRAAHNVPVLSRPLDATDPAGVEDFINQVTSEWGRLDICVANAGGPPAKPFVETTTHEWRSAVETNFLSVVHLFRAAIPHLQQRKWGRLITITSSTVKQPLQDLVLSNAVRAGVVGLVKSLANELGRDGILVNNVAPGYTATDRLHELAARRAGPGGKAQDVFERWAADVPVGRVANPAEIADAVVWLASERASYVTGQTLLVDGGKYPGL